MNGSVDGVQRLLNALTAMALLEKSKGRFSCSPSVRALLAKDSPAYIVISSYTTSPDGVLARLDQSFLPGARFASVPPSAGRNGAKASSWDVQYGHGSCPPHSRRH